MPKRIVPKRVEPWKLPIPVLIVGSAAAVAVCAVLAAALLPRATAASGGGGCAPGFTAAPQSTSAGTGEVGAAGSTAFAPAPVTSREPGGASVKREPGKALIVFTFDDGYISDYNLAWPILKQYGIRGTSYIIGKFPDGSVPDTLTWGQIQEMHAWGWDFGCHTYDHVDMTTLTPGQIRESLEKVNKSFEAHGLPAPSTLAYPSGKYNQQVIDVVKQYYKFARLAFYQSNFVNLDALKPYEVDSISADMQEEPRLKSREALVDKACREDAIIVFRTHCMYFEHKDDNGKWDVQTDSRLFAQLVKYCVDKGCQFMTMDQLLQLYSQQGN